MAFSGALGFYREALGAILDDRGRSWRSLGAILAQLGPILAPSWPNLGPFWPHLGSILAPFWSILPDFGTILASSWPAFRSFWGQAPCRYLGRTACREFLQQALSLSFFLRAPRGQWLCHFGYLIGSDLGPPFAHFGSKLLADTLAEPLLGIPPGLNLI